ncbi:uncharacterized protein SOCEGT47_083090 [Sorangium cellulosum]|uniref:Uncharacterized protein n=1 Tax=Sorangium cellulosum TaxID=56 RepID=A0A4P2QE50_SORCE|nr:hypothetical protein [Sorangium cellulosum]AUX27711.1 uncharacterized protein SOCEGT47_083090 [Sorangium cellulosum]
MLIHFISDYMRNPEIRRRASGDPVTVLAEYGISLEVQQALRRHDREAILKIALEELTVLLSGHNKDGGYHVTAWGPVNIQVTSVSPSTATVDSSTPLTVEGVSFPPKDMACLSFRHEQSQERVDGTIASITTEPSGHSTLRGQVKLPSVGLWKVSVGVKDNPGSAGEWNGDFTVTAG